MEQCSIFRVLIGSVDVIHAFAVPVLSVKCDTVPGRCNGLSIFSSSVGSLFGQCSEICGSFHSFMPLQLVIS